MKNGFKTPQPQRSKHPEGNDYHNQSLINIRQPQFNDSEKKENQMIINGKKEKKLKTNTTSSENVNTTNRFNSLIEKFNISKKLL